MAVLPPCSTNFYVAKSRSGVYFLQREKLVILVGNDINLQGNIDVRQATRKCFHITWPHEEIFKISFMVAPGHPYSMARGFISSRATLSDTFVG